MIGLAALNARRQLSALQTDTGATAGATAGDADTGRRKERPQRAKGKTFNGIVMGCYE